jgi:DNA-binding phage protein
MLDDDARARAGQLTALSTMPPEELAYLPKLRARLDHIDPPERLPLVTLALGSLAVLSTRQAAHFAEQIAAVRGGLLPLSHRAFCVCRLASRHLAAPRDTWSRTRVHRSKLSVSEAIARLLGVVARRGNSSTETAERAFLVGQELLHPALKGKGLPHLRELELDRIDEALDVLVEHTIQTRTQIVDALTATAREDGIVRALEAELLNTFRVCLDVAKFDSITSTGPRSKPVGSV